MIEGWEKETCKLNEFEFKMAGLVTLGLKNKWGRENAITSKAMIDGLMNHGHKVGEARLRKIINYIRIEHMITNLVSYNGGYYRTNDTSDLERYKRSLDQRIGAIQELRNSYD